MFENVPKNLNESWEDPAISRHYGDHRAFPRESYCVTHSQTTVRATAWGLLQRLSLASDLDHLFTRNNLDPLTLTLASCLPFLAELALMRI